MTGYFLILAVLVLGGVIATVGDRIGMRVGKARLTLFNLRPRQTATVVSIMTGGVISASTLALMFAVSDQLRTGLFELETLQSDLEEARFDLDQAQQAKVDIESALASATQEQAKAEERLAEINQRLKSTEAQLSQTQEQLGVVSRQDQRLRSEIRRLQSERQALLKQQANVRAQIAQRDRDIAQRDREISERDEAIAQRQGKLESLEAQQRFLDQEVNRLTEDVERLTDEALDLRRGSVTLRRNQVLASVVFTATSLENATQAVQQLFRDANEVAFQQLLGANAADEQIIRIRKDKVDELLNRISDGQEYVVRILSAANYFAGEPCVVEGQEPCIDVHMVADVNRVIYQTGDIIATIPVEAAQLANQQLGEQLRVLRQLTQVQALRDGVVFVDPVRIAVDQRETLISFLQQLEAYGRGLDLQAIAAEPIFTIGPIRIELVAIKNGEVLFQTGLDPS